MFGLNELIAIFFLLGWLAYRRPIRYIHAFQNSTRRRPHRPAVPPVRRLDGSDGR